MSVSLAAKLEGVFVVDQQDNLLLDDVSLAVLPAESLALCGPTGGGKTLILRLLAGLIEPSLGVVLVGGQRVSSLDYEGMRSLRLRVGMAFEDGGFWANRSVLDNIALPMRYHRPDSADADLKARDLADELGIADALAQGGSHAIGSVRKRALLARALLFEPALLLCDEPQRGLLPRESRRASEAIERRRKGRGLTVVYADHDGSLGPFACDRRFFFEQGRSVERPSMVISRHDLEAMGLGVPTRLSLMGDAPDNSP